MAGRSISRILSGACPRCGRRAGATIPLGPESLRDSSGLPEGHKRAGPALPSYLALLHAGFTVPRASPPERWALTPPFHPCPAQPTCGRRPEGFASGLSPRSHCTGGLFSVALSVAEPSRTRPPGVTRRVALRSPDFPPSRQNRDSDRPTYPPTPLYRIPPAAAWATMPAAALTAACRYFSARSFSKADSSRILTPSDLALSYFEPGSAPTTT